jgi:AcrR family transcriptional regulator
MNLRKIRMRSTTTPETTKARGRAVTSAAEDERNSIRTSRLLDDLESIVLHEGFLHLRTDDLAKRLRCSKRTLYRLARTREELFELVIEKWLTRIREDGLQAIRSAKDVHSAVTGYLNAAVRDTRDASPTFVRDLARFPAGTRRLMLHQKKRIAGLEKLIDEGVRTGVFRGVHARLVAEVLLVAVARIVDPDLLSGCDLTMSQAFGELYDIFEYGLTPAPPGDGRARGDGAVARRSAGKTGRGTASSESEVRHLAATLIDPDLEIGEDEPRLPSSRRS